MKGLPFTSIISSLRRPIEVLKIDLEVEEVAVATVRITMYSARSLQYLIAKDSS
jgi:hypothetical protein